MSHGVTNLSRVSVKKQHAVYNLVFTVCLCQDCK